VLPKQANHQAAHSANVGGGKRKLEETLVKSYRGVGADRREELSPINQGREVLTCPTPRVKDCSWRVAVTFEPADEELWGVVSPT
jgi:hypothetical protein